MKNKIWSKVIRDKKSESKYQPRGVGLHHKIAKDKTSQKHLTQEQKYHDLHKAYNNATTEKEKIMIAKKIKAMHYKIHASRTRMHKNNKHHALLHKLHNTKDSKELHKAVHIDKSRHEIIDDTTEIEHTKLIKHVVPPIKSHVLSDIGRGLKSILIGGGQLISAGTYRAGQGLSALAQKLSASNTTPTPTNYSSLGIDKV